MELTKKECCAALVYVLRSKGKIYPKGTFDRKQRWYPSDEEECSCCSNIRRPSAAFPYSLLSHCKTRKHVARLYGVEEKRINDIIRILESYDVITPEFLRLVESQEGDTVSNSGLAAYLLTHAR